MEFVLFFMLYSQWKRTSHHDLELTAMSLRAGNLAIRPSLLVISF
jgi:hypothetical protein